VLGVVGKGSPSNPEKKNINDSLSYTQPGMDGRVHLKEEAREQENTFYSVYS